MGGLVYSIIYNLFSKISILLSSYLGLLMLNKHDYGLFSYYTMLIANLSIFFICGGSLSVNQAYSSNIKSGLEKEAILASHFLILLILSILASFFLYFNYNLYYILAIFISFFMGASALIEGKMYATKNYKNMAVNAIISFIIMLPLIYFFIKKYNILGALFALLLYRFILLALNLYKSDGLIFIKKESLAFMLSKKNIQYLKKNSLPIFLSALCVAPVYFICINLGKYYGLSYEKLGEFSWFFQIYNIAVFFPSVIVGFTLKKFNEDKSRLNKIFKYYLIFSIICSLSLIFLKDFIFFISKLKGSEDINTLYYCMIFSMFLYILNSSFSGYWISQNFARIGFFINLIWAIFVILLNWILMLNNMGFESIFISTGIAYIILISFQLMLKRKF